MSNQTLEYAKVDVGNFMAAKMALNLPGIATDVDGSMANHERCRTYIVATYTAVTLPAPVIHRDYYVLALSALAAKNELKMEKAPEPKYKMGVLFDEESDEKHEPAPLPPSPNDPWLQNELKENMKQSAEDSFRRYGRVLNPTELAQAQRLEAFHATAGKYDESETVHKVINGKSYIDRTATAKVRAEARAKNLALKEKS
jgi:hypothetical protein